MYVTPYNTTYVSWQLTSIRLPHSPELITFDYNKSIHSNFGYQQTEPAVRFRHFYELWCSPDVFDVTVHTYTRQHAYQMKLLTSVTYGTTTIRINYKDDTNSEYYNYAQSISIKDGDRLVRTINLEQHQGTLQSSSLSKSLSACLTASLCLAVMMHHPRPIGVDIHLRMPTLVEQPLG